jgi:hypothetical protein
MSVSGMNADESRGKRISRLTILGIIFLVIGLLIAVLYIYNINYDYGAGNEMGMVNDLAYIGLAIAIELFGIGLIILDKK